MAKIDKARFWTGVLYPETVSYTHLDVYKRQLSDTPDTLSDTLSDTPDTLCCCPACGSIDVKKNGKTLAGKGRLRCNEIEQGNSVVCICVSSGISGTYQSACVAKEMIGARGKVDVLDSKACGITLGIAAVMAARLAREGADHEMVVAQASKRLAKMRTLVMLDSLDFLVMGGRISAITAKAATLLNIKPVISFDQNGKIYIEHKAVGDVYKRQVRKMKKKKLVSLLLVAAFAMLALAGCQGTSAPQNTPDPTPDVTKTQALNVAVLKGPTAIGAAKLIENSSAYKSVSVVAAPEEMQTKFISGEVDIAAVPTNLASVLYNKTEGDVQILAINTLGVLYILSSDESVTSVQDLRGRTIVTSGQGSVPEYALNYVLEQNGLTVGTDVTVEYKSEHSEVATLAVSGKADIIMVPEPFVTNILNKQENMKVAIDLTEEWENLNADAPLVMGCIIAHKDTDPAAIEAFLADYKTSTEFANQSVDATAKIIGDAGILDEAVVKQAIPRCNIVCLTGAEMKTAMEKFLGVLLEEKGIIKR